MLISLIISAEVVDSYGFNVLASQLKKTYGSKIKLQLFYIFHKFNEYYPQPVIDDLVSLCKGSDLIGISLLSSAYRNSIQITRAIREKINCPVIWGGKHPTISPEDCLEHADVICVGEGEDALSELIEKMNSNKDLTDIHGLWFKKNGSIVKNELRPPETNLDRFAYPDYSLNDKFILDTQRMRIRPLERKDLVSMSWYPTMITRGCPNFCTFCINSVDKRLRKMRSRSVDNVIREIKEFLSLYPEIKSVFFRDDCLSAMPLEYIKEFTSRYKEEVNLPCSLSGIIATSPDFETKVELLTKAGFIHFKMGIQSGCERVRRKVFARIGEYDHVIKKADSILHLISSGEISYYMITDNPYETEKELAKSIRFTSRLVRPFKLSLYSLNFYPGTSIYNMALRDGLLKDQEKALLKSTMEFNNTYLNKVFFTLRLLEIPPFLIYFMTHRNIYTNPLYKKCFNSLFRYFFQTNEPTRRIGEPKGGFFLFKQLKLSKFMRWYLWRFIKLSCQFLHRGLIKPDRGIS